ncbi:MAG: hypothetical protein M0Z42_13190 [Actinomycetota bacterium]|nr:hypothetical protein [Actinomycetota bacterium]
MTSAALDRWRNQRAKQLDELVDAHVAISGTAAGRRWATAELNRALILRLASQFQGFARDLHGETAITFGELAHPTDPVLARVVATGLQVNRQLDHKNAQEDSLSSDFSRVGIQLWAEMDARHRRTAARRLHLRAFNRARNGLAHDDQRAVAEVLAAGYRMDLAGIRQWRAALDGLADTMDDVLAAHLGRLFKVARPW